MAIKVTKIVKKEVRRGIYTSSEMLDGKGEKLPDYTTISTRETMRGTKRFRGIYCNFLQLGYRFYMIISPFVSDDV